MITNLKKREKKWEMMIVLIFLNSVFMHVNMCTYTKHTHKHEVNVCVCVCEKEREMRVCVI